MFWMKFLLQLVQNSWIYCRSMLMQNMTEILMTAPQWLNVRNKTKDYSLPYWIQPLPIYHMNGTDHTSRPISCDHLKQVFSIKSLAFKNNFQFVEHRDSARMCLGPIKTVDMHHQTWCMARGNATGPKPTHITRAQCVPPPPYAFTFQFLL